MTDQNEDCMQTLYANPALRRPQALPVAAAQDILPCFISVLLFNISARSALSVIRSDARVLGHAFCCEETEPCVLYLRRLDAQAVLRLCVLPADGAAARALAAAGPGGCCGGALTTRTHGL